MKSIRNVAIIVSGLSVSSLSMAGLFSSKLLSAMKAGKAEHVASLLEKDKYREKRPSELLEYMQFVNSPISGLAPAKSEEIRGLFVDFLVKNGDHILKGRVHDDKYKHSTKAWNEFCGLYINLTANKLSTSQFQALPRTCPQFSEPERWPEAIVRKLTHPSNLSDMLGLSYNQYGQFNPYLIRKVLAANPSFAFYKTLLQTTIKDLGRSTDAVMWLRVPQNQQEFEEVVKLVGDTALATTAASGSYDVYIDHYREFVTLPFVMNTLFRMTNRTGYRVDHLLVAKALEAGKFDLFVEGRSLLELANSDYALFQQVAAKFREKYSFSLLKKVLETTWGKQVAYNLVGVHNLYLGSNSEEVQFILETMANQELSYDSLEAMQNFLAAQAARVEIPAIFLSAKIYPKLSTWAIDRLTTLDKIFIRACLKEGNLAAKGWNSETLLQAAIRLHDSALISEVLRKTLGSTPSFAVFKNMLADVAKAGDEQVLRAVLNAYEPKNQEEVNSTLSLLYAGDIAGAYIEKNHDKVSLSYVLDSLCKKWADFPESYRRSINRVVLKRAVAENKLDYKIDNKGLLEFALSQGDQASINELLRRSNRTALTSEELGISLLAAFERNDETAARNLMAMGADVHRRGSNGFTPFEYILQSYPRMLVTIAPAQLKTQEQWDAYLAEVGRRQQDLGAGVYDQALSKYRQFLAKEMAEKTWTYSEYFVRQGNLSIAEEHLQRALLKVPKIDTLPEVTLARPLSEICQTLIRAVNFRDRNAAGYVPPEELFEDGHQRSPEEAEGLFCGFANKVQTEWDPDLRKKFNYVLARLSGTIAPTVVVEVKNTLLAEMAMAGTHCTTRARAMVNRAFATVATDEEPNFAVQLENLLTHWRGELITQTFVPMHRGSSGNEFGHTQVYWAGRLGYYVGVKLVPPHINFPYMNYVEGSEHNKSIEENLHRYFSVYTPKALIDFVADHLQNPGNYPKTERLGGFGEWLETMGKSMADYYDEMGLQLDKGKLAELLTELGYLKKA